MHVGVEVVHGRIRTRKKRLLVLELLQVDGRNLDGCIEHWCIIWESTKVRVHAVLPLHTHTHVESRLLHLRIELVATILWRRDVTINLAMIGSGSRTFLGMAILSMFTAWSSAAIAGRQSNFIHQSLVTLGRLSLESEKDVSDILHNLGSNALVEEWGGQDLEDQSCTASVVREDGLEGFIVW